MFSNELLLTEFYHVLMYAFVSLFSIVNPIGTSAVFLTLTKGVPLKARHHAIKLVTIYGAVLVTATFFIGKYILLFFGVSLHSIQIAGGAVVFKTAWDVLSGEKTESGSSIGEKSLEKKLFFPLTMPITAGAGSIAVAISLSANPLKSHLNYLAFATANLIAICLVFISIALSYRYSDIIFKKLGTAGTEIVAKVTAFIMLAIGVTIAWNGMSGLISTFLKSL